VAVGHRKDTRVRVKRSCGRGAKLGRIKAAVRGRMQRFRPDVLRVYLLTCDAV